MLNTSSVYSRFLKKLSSPWVVMVVLCVSQAQTRIQAASWDDESAQPASPVTKAASQSNANHVNYFATRIHPDSSKVIPSEVDALSNLGHQASPHITPCQDGIERRLYEQKILDTPSLAERFEPFRGLKISTISVERIDVFDEVNPQENNALFRFVNTLNIKTRESAIRPQLLFQLGDRLEPAILAETERLLRSSGYLANAYIMPVAHCDGLVDLRVVTQDAWTTQPIISASKAGGQSESKLGLVEGNFLGMGSEVSVVLTSDDQRSAVAYKFKQDFIGGKPLALSFGFSDNSDGYVRNVQFAKPFYTDNTQTAFNTSIEQSQAITRVEQNGNVLAEYAVERENKTAFGGVQKALKANSVFRLYAGISQEQRRYGAFDGINLLVPERERDLIYPWFALEKKSTQYTVAKNINSIGLVEDLRLGAYWRVSLGYSPARDQFAAAWVFSSIYDELFYFNNQYLGVSMSFDSVNYNNSNALASEARQAYYSATASTRYHILMGDNQRLFFTAGYAKGTFEAIDQLERVGGLQAVRGYPADYALGNQVLNASMEYRYHSDFHLLNILHVGAALYVDTAILKNTQFTAINNQGYNGELLSGVGVGLRLASSKTHVGNVVHIDIASPIGYRENTGNYEVIISAQSTF